MCMPVALHCQTASTADCILVSLAAFFVSHKRVVASGLDLALQRRCLQINGSSPSGVDRESVHVADSFDCKVGSSSLFSAEPAAVAAECQLRWSMQGSAQVCVSTSALPVIVPGNSVKHLAGRSYQSTSLAPLDPAWLMCHAASLPA